MNISYNGLWKILIDHEMKKTDLISKVGISSSTLAKMITAQASGHESLHVVDTSELYTEDVQLISKDGKIYYLPESKEE